MNFILELVEYEAKKVEVLRAKPQSLGCKKRGKSVCKSCKREL